MREIEPSGDLSSSFQRKAGELLHDGLGNTYRAEKDSYYDETVGCYFTPSRLVKLGRADYVVRDRQTK